MNPLLVIPGGGNGSPETALEVLRDTGRTVLALPETNKPWDDAKTITDFILEHQLIGCHVIGCSLGGVTALHWLRNFPIGSVSLVSSVHTVDSPLYGIDKYLTWLGWVLAGKPYYSLWPDSGFMKSLRETTLVPIVPATQWMNDYQGTFGGFTQQVLDNAPTPHFNEPHVTLYDNPFTWARVLEGLD